MNYKQSKYKSDCQPKHLKAKIDQKLRDLKDSSSKVQDVVANNYAECSTNTFTQNNLDDPLSSSTRQKDTMFQRMNSQNRVVKYGSFYGEEINGESTSMGYNNLIDMALDNSQSKITDQDQLQLDALFNVDSSNQYISAHVTKSGSEAREVAKIKSQQLNKTNQVAQITQELNNLDGNTNKYKRERQLIGCSMDITDQSKRITKERDLSKSEVTVVTKDLKNIEKQGNGMIIADSPLGEMRIEEFESQQTKKVNEQHNQIIGKELDDIGQHLVDYQSPTVNLGTMKDSPSNDTMTNGMNSVILSKSYPKGLLTNENLLKKINLSQSYHNKDHSSPPMVKVQNQLNQQQQQTPIRKNKPLEMKYQKNYSQHQTQKFELRKSRSPMKGGPSKMSLLDTPYQQISSHKDFISDNKVQKNSKQSEQVNIIVNNLEMTSMTKGCLEAIKDINSVSRESSSRNHVEVLPLVNLSQISKDEMPRQVQNQGPEKDINDYNQNKSAKLSISGNDFPPCSKGDSVEEQELKMLSRTYDNRSEITNIQASPKKNFQKQFSPQGKKSQILNLDQHNTQLKQSQQIKKHNMSQASNNSNEMRKNSVERSISFINENKFTYLKKLASDYKIDKDLELMKKNLTRQDSFEKKSDNSGNQISGKRNQYKSSMQENQDTKSVENLQKNLMSQNHMPKLFKNFNVTIQKGSNAAQTQNQSQSKEKMNSTSTTEMNLKKQNETNRVTQNKQMRSMIRLMGGNKDFNQTKNTNQSAPTPNLQIEQKEKQKNTWNGSIQQPKLAKSISASKNSLQQQLKMDDKKINLKHDVKRAMTPQRTQSSMKFQSHFGQVKESNQFGERKMSASSLKPSMSYLKKKIQQYGKTAACSEVHTSKVISPKAKMMSGPTTNTNVRPSSRQQKSQHNFIANESRLSSLENNNFNMNAANDLTSTSNFFSNLAISGVKTQLLSNSRDNSVRKKESQYSFDRDKEEAENNITIVQALSADATNDITLNVQYKLPQSSAKEQSVQKRDQSEGIKVFSPKIINKQIIQVVNQPEVKVIVKQQSLVEYHKLQMQQQTEVINKEKQVPIEQRISDRLSRESHQDSRGSSKKQMQRRSSQASALQNKGWKPASNSQVQQDAKTKVQKTGTLKSVIVQAQQMRSKSQAATKYHSRQSSTTNLRQPTRFINKQEKPKQISAQRLTKSVIPSQLNQKRVKSGSKDRESSQAKIIKMSSVVEIDLQDIKRQVQSYDHTQQQNQRLIKKNLKAKKPLNVSTSLVKVNNLKDQNTQYSPNKNPYYFQRNSSQPKNDQLYTYDTGIRNFKLITGSHLNEKISISCDNSQILNIDITNLNQTGSTNGELTRVIQKDAKKEDDEITMSSIANSQRNQLSQRMVVKQFVNNQKSLMTANSNDLSSVQDLSFLNGLSSFDQSNLFRSQMPVSDLKQKSSQFKEQGKMVFDYSNYAQKMTQGYLKKKKEYKVKKISPFDDNCKQRYPVDFPFEGNENISDGQLEEFNPEESLLNQESISQSNDMLQFTLSSNMRLMSNTPLFEQFDNHYKTNQPVPGLGITKHAQQAPLNIKFNSNNMPKQIDDLDQEPNDSDNPVEEEDENDEFPKKQFDRIKQHHNPAIIRQDASKIYSNNQMMIQKGLDSSKLSLINFQLTPKSSIEYPRQLPKNIFYKQGQTPMQTTSSDQNYQQQFGNLEEDSFELIRIKQKLKYDNSLISNQIQNITNYAPQPMTRTPHAIQEEIRDSIVSIQDINVKNTNKGMLQNKNKQYFQDSDNNLATQSLTSMKLKGRPQSVKAAGIKSKGSVRNQQRDINHKRDNNQQKGKSITTSKWNV